MVERRSPKPDVEGSSPSGRELTNKRKKLMSQDKKVQQNNYKDSIIAYFKGVKAEWSKVSWPTRRQVVVEAVIVLAVVIFFTLVVYFMDIIFKALLGLIK